MIQPLKQRLSGLWDSWNRLRHDSLYSESRPGEVQHLIEGVVDGTDSRIRFVPGYRRKLQGVIQDALEYTSGLVDQIPEAIEIRRSTFVSNPYVNAFFTNVADLQSVCRQSSEIREYMENSEEAAFGECCALLCMHMSRKTVLGMDISGDMLRKDVQQMAVSFSDHRIYSPAPSEQETRAGLRQCLFQGLATTALGRIMEIRLDNHKLTHEVQKQRASLRQHQKQADNATQASEEATPALDVAREKLAMAERKLLHARPATPQTCLGVVTSVFRHPDEFVRMQRIRLKLNKMGIVIDDDSRQPCNDLDLTEVTIGNEQPRVVSLARLPLNELFHGSGLT